MAIQPRSFSYCRKMELCKNLFCAVSFSPQKSISSKTRDFSRTRFVASQRQLQENVFTCANLFGGGNLIVPPHLTPQIQCLPANFQILLALPNKVLYLDRAHTTHHFRIAPPPPPRAEAAVPSAVGRILLPSGCCHCRGGGVGRGGGRRGGGR